MGLMEILNRRQREVIVNDDLHVVSTNTEYEYDGKTMKYLIYEIEVMDKTGELKRVFKAVKFCRILRLPHDAKQSMAFMDMHDQVIGALWERGINYVTLIANMLKPVALGLLFLYGIQGVAETLDDAKRIADHDYAALAAMLQGTYRTLEFRPLNHEELEWLREKMYSMKHLIALRGLPLPRKGGVDAGNKGFGGKNINPESQSTTEEFVAGMADREYVIQILATPIGHNILRQWLTQTSKLLTGWNAQLQGSKAMSFGISMPLVYAANLGASQGWSHGYSDAQNVGYSQSHSTGTSFSESVSTSQGISRGLSVSESASISHSEGDNVSVSKGHTEGTSYGFNYGENASYSHGRGMSDSHGINVGSSNSVSEGISRGTSNNWNSGGNDGSSMGGQISYKAGAMVAGLEGGTNYSNNKSFNESIGGGVSDGTNRSWADSISNGENWSNSRSENWSNSIGQSKGESYGANISDSTSISRGYSRSDGWTKGISQSENVGSSAGISRGITKGTNESTSFGENWGRSQGQSFGTSGGFSQGTGASVGLGPSLSFSKSFQWLDAEVENIVRLLEFQRERLMKSLQGNGAFFVDIYIATSDDESKAAAAALAKSTWYNEHALICPLQVMDLLPEEEAHMLYHFNAFSADTTIEGIPGQLQSYRYSTVLLPEEIVAYTHPPRISEGGVYADVQDIPKLAVPSMRKGEIFMGRILSGERWTQRWGYVTPYNYCISQEEIMHGFFTGESRSGKTVAATRFIAEVANKVVRPTGKRMRIICMDPKQDWRILAKFVEPERFHFYSLGNPEFCPINLNPCKIPTNVYPQQWIDGLIEIFCRSYGLGERGKQIMGETVYELYEEAGVFEENWRQVAPERSKQVTFAKIYKRMKENKQALESGNTSRGKIGNDVRDAYSRVLDRLQVFGREFSIEYKMFGREDGMGIDDLIGKDDVVVLESYGLENTFKNFIFGVITSGFFKWAQAHEGGFKAPDQYETILVIEEANEILVGSDSNNKDSVLTGQSEFEKILDQAAGLGLFIIAITQKIADMPSSVVANSGLVFAGKISREKDVTTIIRKIGREERIDDRDLVKWFPRAPIGWFVCRSSRNYDFKELEPSLVKIEPLNVTPPNNQELEHIIALKRARLRQTK